MKELATGRDDFAAPVERLVRRVRVIVRDRTGAAGIASVADDERPSIDRRWDRPFFCSIVATGCCFAAAKHVAPRHRATLS